MSDSLSPDNPLAHPSDRPYGLPPFERIGPKDLAAAVEVGMAEQLAEIEAILSDPAPASVANTLDALEASGALLTRACRVLFNLTGSDETDELRAVEADVAPRLTAHHDQIWLDGRLHDRVEQLARNAADGGQGWDEETTRLLERYRTDLLRSGAALEEADRGRLREINGELSTLTTTFKNLLQDDTTDLAVHVETREELDGLPPDAIDAARAAAHERGLDHGYLLTLILPTGQPALEALSNRDVRRRLHQASVVRGSRGNAFDTRATLTRIVALRAERAALLGYVDHASYVIADETAGSLEAVDTMLAGLVAPAAANGMAEAAELAAAMASDGVEGPLEPWDWAYYADRVRRERFDLDTAQLRPYFELGRVVRDGVFAAATELYGLSFEQRTDLPAYHPDVQIWEVREADGAGLGLVLTDWYARDSKRGGAWMDSFVTQSSLIGTQPVVVINLNIPRPPDGQPTLLTLDEVDTAFHEFGHVLHGLFSSVRYPRFSGTSVPRDFVEFPSQVNEMWAWFPSLLARYAVHHGTGLPLPQETVDRLVAAQAYGQGFATCEYLAAALLDLEWHRLPHGSAVVAASDVAAFEQAALAKHGLDLPLIPTRYRSTYFAHVFAGGYSAAYYAYIWSEVLDADTVDWFNGHRDDLGTAGARFRSNLLSRGGSVDPMAAFAAVLGRPPRVEPLLERRGLLPVTS